MLITIMDEKSRLKCNEMFYGMRRRVQGFKKLRPSVDFEREMGNEGDLTIGVFFLDIFMRASWMTLKGSLLSGSMCQQSYIKSWNKEIKIRSGDGEVCVY